MGHIPIDVHALGVDMLSASAHKFNGPRGIGFLYIKRGIKLQPFVDGGAQESGHRAGTENTAYIVAMAAALKKNCLSLEENKVKLRKLELQLLNGLHSAGIRFIKNGGKLISLKGMPNPDFAERIGLGCFKKLILKCFGKKMII